MNRKKILGIIFVIAALVCLHGFSTAMSREDGHTTKTMEQIEKAVFLQNGKVDKDNEGKPVIVGTAEAIPKAERKSQQRKTKASRSYSP